MSGKKTELYKEIFDFIEKKLIQLKPAQFMTDFEAGLRKAINEFYPDAILYGCWYHFCSAVRRKFMSLDMYELISKVPAAKLIYRMILSVPLLPAELICKGYNIVKEEATKKKLDKKFKKIFEYFEQYWLEQVGFFAVEMVLIKLASAKCVFRFSNNIYFHLICIFPYQKNKRNSISVAQLSMRTISSLESMHSMLNRSLAQKKHFFKFVECLRVHESRKADNFFSLLNGLPATRFQRNMKNQRRDDKIKHFTALLLKKTLDVKQFSQAMADDCKHNFQYLIFFSHFLSLCCMFLCVKFITSL